MKVYYSNQVLRREENLNSKTGNMRNLGIALILIGIIMMWVTGLNFVTHEKVVDVGPVQITADKNNPVQWSPIIGAVILVAGIVVVVTYRKK